MKYCNNQLNGKKLNCIATNILECDVCINSTHCSECVAPLAAYMIDRTNDSTTSNGCFITSTSNCTQYILKDNKIECTSCAKGYHVTSMGTCARTFLIQHAKDFALRAMAMRPWTARNAELSTGFPQM